MRSSERRNDGTVRQTSEAMAALRPTCLHEELERGSMLDIATANISQFAISILHVMRALIHGLWMLRYQSLHFRQPKPWRCSISCTFVFLHSQRSLVGGKASSCSSESSYIFAEVVLPGSIPGTYCEAAKSVSNPLWSGSQLCNLLCR